MSWDIKLMPPSLSPWEPKGRESKQIAVLMSGGVDSSVTAHLLKKAGYEPLGITMKVPVSCDTGKRGCCGVDAAFVCNELNIPHYFVDVTKAFEELIINPFRQSYAQGKTPNPCVDCNTLLKFSLVWDLIETEFGITHLATGHYARVSKIGDSFYLGRAKNTAKDQSYFLYGIAQEKLANFVLPLGELTKEDVRLIANDSGLTVAEKAESMELCFAGEGDYRMALTESQTNCTGDIIDMQGNKIGIHKGVANYTLGQRRGIGFAGGEPLYVGRINAAANTIALGSREEVSCRTVRAEKINVLISEELIVGKRIYGKIRSYGPSRPCKIIETTGENIAVEFEEAQFAPSPGQKLVLYNNDDNIIAGGTIYL